MHLFRRPIVALAAICTTSLAAQELHVPSQFPTIQAAIDAALQGERIVVADGIYSGPGNSNIKFHGEDLVVESAHGAERCVIDCQGSLQDPSRGFLFETAVGRDSILRGFTIVNGSTEAGAIRDRYNGGAIRLRNGASPTIEDCVFRNNTAGCWGGAIYAGTRANPLILRCMFEGNRADDGGAFFSWLGGRAEIHSSVFLRNVALSVGGAIADFGSSGVQLEHCTLSENVARWGGSAIEASRLSVRNSIIWNNLGRYSVTAGQAIEYSIVQDGNQGVGNSRVDPRFRVDGYHLDWDSPCLNAGSFDPAGSATDIDGQPRQQDGRVDIGADESRTIVTFGKR